MKFLSISCFHTFGSKSGHQCDNMKYLYIFPSIFKLVWISLLKQWDVHTFPIMPQSTKRSKYHFSIIWAKARVACAHLRASWILIMKEMQSLSYIKPSSDSSQCFLCVLFKSSFIFLKKNIQTNGKYFFIWCPDSKSLAHNTGQSLYTSLNAHLPHNSQQWVCSTLRVPLCYQLWSKHSIKLWFTHYFFNQTLLVLSLWRQK